MEPTWDRSADKVQAPGGVGKGNKKLPPEMKDWVGMTLEMYRSGCEQDKAQAVALKPEVDKLFAEFKKGFGEEAYPEKLQKYMACPDVLTLEEVRSKFPEIMIRIDAVVQSGLAEEAKAQRERAEAATEQVERMQGQMDGLRREVQRVTNHNRQLVRDGNVGTIHELRRAVANGRQTVQQLRETTGELTEALDEAEREVRELRQSIADLQAENLQAEELLGVFEESNEEVEVKVKKAAQVQAMLDGKRKKRAEEAARAAKRRGQIYCQLRHGKGTLKKMG